MGITTIRPNGDYGRNANPPYGAYTSDWQTLSDNDDASAIILYGASGSYVEVYMGDIGAPAANQRILQVRSVARIAPYNTGLGMDFQLHQNDGSGDQYVAYDSGAGGIRTVYGGWQLSTPDGFEWSVGRVNGLRVRGVSGGGGATAARLYEFYADVDVRTQPNVLSTGPSGFNPGATRSPTVTWAFQDPDGVQGQFGYHVKVFTAAQTDPEVGGAVYDSGDVVGGNTNHTVPNLADGTYYIYVKVSKDFRGGHWWSTWGSGVAGSTSTITINDTPATPTTVTPINVSTINTSKPTLGATVVASPLSTPGYIEWQVASDSGFTTNLRTITEPVGDATVSGAHTEPWGAATRIAQGVWYVRARTHDATGKIGAWSGANSFTVSHPPAAANFSPTGDVTLIYGATGTVSFTWAFTDPDVAGDSQTAYQVIVERNDTGAVLVDSGKVASATASYSFNIPAIQKDQPLRWRVRLWDLDDVAGAYSSNQLFRIADAPQVAITYPSSGGLINNARPNFTWTVGLSGGRTVVSARVRVQVVGAALGSTADSGVLTGPVFAWQPAQNILVNGTNYTIQVDVVDSVAIAATATQSFTVQFSQPRPVPFVLDASSYDALGYVGLTWDNSTQDGQFTRYRVYRRIPGTLAWTFVKEVGTVQAAYAVQDQLAAAGVTYEWTVTQLGIRFGIEIESPRPGENRTPSFGFEASSSGWTLDGSGGSATRLTTDGSGGSTSCVELIDTSAVANTRLLQANVDDTPVAAGETLNLDVDLKILDSVTTPYLVFTFSDGISISFQITGLVANAWTNVKRSFVVPAGKVAGYMMVTPGDPSVVTSTGQVRVDNAQVYSSAQTATPVTTNYWLIDPDNYLNSLALWNVTTESFSTEYEEAFIPLIGRGRKRDIGTRLGVTGQLTTQIRDRGAVTARTQRLALENLRNLRKTLYLRNPFGDVYQIAAGAIGIDRLAGTGLNEYSTATVPYQEVAA